MCGPKKQCSQGVYGIMDISHRTNSLGHAKHDCHTCSALKNRCDRQRPQCGPCISSGRKCGGFVMDLTWKDLAVTGKTTASSSGDGLRLVECQTGSLDERHRFRFVCGRPTKKRKAKKPDPRKTRLLPVHDTLSPYSIFSVGSVDPRPSPEHAEYGSLGTAPSPASPGHDTSGTYDEEHIPPNTRGTSADVSSSSGTSLFLPDSLADPQPYEPTQPEPLGTTSHFHADNVQPGLSESDEFIWELAPAASPQSHVTPSLGYVPGDRQLVVDNAGDILDLPAEEAANQDIPEELPPLYTGVTYQNLSHKYNAVLTMYDERFCVLPLSNDCPNNPFRVRRNHVESFPFLMHAVLAISAQHLARERPCTTLISEMNNHWSAAIHHFSRALSQSRFLPLLDTLLILVSFGTTQSAYGVWDVHLGGASRLLQEVGGMEGYQHNSRMRAQVAMLVWWDVTVSLISRRQPRLPITYLETLTRYGKSDGWSYFALNGCPIDLVVAMARLARLAETYEQTTRMEWTTFNTLPVERIVDDVKSYTNEEAIFGEMETLEDEDTDGRQNRFHCIEAWRHAILLYACRVFNPQQDAYGLRQINYLSRVILDSVRCIPPTETIQKQLLLPIFLAASEVGDEFNRSFVREYCKHWSDASHFYQFETTAALLEDIWSHWSSDTRDVYWWGVRVNGQDGRHFNPGGESMTQELLLG